MVATAGTPRMHTTHLHIRLVRVAKLYWVAFAPILYNRSLFIIVAAQKIVVFPKSIRHLLYFSVKIDLCFCDGFLIPNRGQHLPVRVL